MHIHAEGPAFFCWIPKLFGKRVISTIHGLDWDREKWRGSVASKFIRGGEKNAVKYADEIIVLSKDVQKYFLETYGRETHFIPNGVNRPEVREAKLITDHFGLEKDSYILFLGRLVPEKGIRYLVEAFKNVKTDKKLVIAGGSSDTDSFMEELKELAKGDDRILFTGFVQGAMLDELYSNAYIYTLPSDLEGMPLSLLEAMSYGNCCLVSDIPECAEVVEDKMSVNISGFFSALTFAGFFSLGQLFYKLWIPNQDIELLYALTVVTILAYVTEGPVHPLYYIYTLTVKNRVPCIITLLGGVLNVVGMFALVRYTNMEIYSIVITTTVITTVTSMITNPPYMAYCLKLKWYTFYPMLLPLFVLLMM